MVLSEGGEVAVSRYVMVGVLPVLSVDVAGDAGGVTVVSYRMTFAQSASMWLPRLYHIRCFAVCVERSRMANVARSVATLEMGP